MAEPTTAQAKCDNCAATMTWDPAAGRLRCEACGAVRAVTDAGRIVEHALEEGLSLSKPRGRLGAGTREVKCQECGAVVELGEGMVATRCSFCDSPQVASGAARDDLILPESLVPFAVGRDKAMAAFATWLKKLWFRPSDLRAKASVEELHGVYVPYWTFDTDVTSSWTADAGYHYYVTEEYRDPQGNRQTRSVQRTRWEPASGQRRDHHDDHLVCASKGLPEKLARKVGNFDTAGLVVYAADYLMGFSAESYAIDLRAAFQTARSEIGALQEARCRGDVPGDTSRNLRANHFFGDTTWKHVLLPVWIAAFRYRDTVFRFLVNGQTGQVSGKAPLSWTKILLFIAVLLAIGAAIVFLVMSR